MYSYNSLQDITMRILLIILLLVSSTYASDRFLVVDEEGNVKNIIISDSNFDPGDGLTLISGSGDYLHAGPGDKIVNGELIKAQPEEYQGE